MVSFFLMIHTLDRWAPRLVTRWPRFLVFVVPFRLVVVVDKSIISQRLFSFLTISKMSHSTFLLDYIFAATFFCTSNLAFFFFYFSASLSYFAGPSRVATAPFFFLLQKKNSHECSLLVVILY